MSGVSSAGPQSAQFNQVVGTCPRVEVDMHGVTVKCLMDTGSQVTLIPESLYRSLPNSKNGTVKNASWLALRAVNGLEIPYLGYALLDIKVGELELPQRGVVVVKDKQGNQQFEPILGMNIIECCWKELFKNPNAKLSFLSEQEKQNSRTAWEGALQICDRVAVVQKETSGFARLGSRHPVSVPPQTQVHVMAKVPAMFRQQTVCIVEPIKQQGSIMVAHSVGVVQQGRIPLRVYNLNSFPVTLQKYQRLATVTSISPEDVRSDNHLTLEEVSPGIMEVRIGHVSTLDPPPLQEVLQGLVQQGVELTPEQRGLVEHSLRQWQDVFSLGEDDHGHTNVVRHTILTGDAAPVRERYRPVPPTLYKEMQSLLKGMLNTGVIRESSSPWAAPVVLVQKKEGSLRFCVDYRKLNSVTHKDAYPLPRIEEALTNLKKAQWYSTLDLAAGYWQVEVDEQDKEKTAFATPMGLYEFQRMPFGLCNGPATFQRLMHRCLGDLNLDTVLIYLDDVIVYSPTFEAHVQHLEEVFQRMRSFGLKLKPEKCALFQKQVRFLGHLVNAEGVRPDPEKTSAVQQWKTPSTVHQVRSFLGFVGYYRRFIGGFAKIARPLNTLLQNTAKYGKKKNAPIEWTSECQTAFDTLKQKLTQSPVLAFADFSLPFRLYTDASLAGLGAVLSQIQQGREYVIAYASRSLHPAEKNDSNYSAFKLELVALKWAITEKFRDFLWGAKFTVFTDHQPLLHLKTARLRAVEQRWISQLENYDFDLRYRPGRENTNADALSRQEMVEEVSVRVVTYRPPDNGTSSHSMEQEVQDQEWGWRPQRWINLQSTDPNLARLRLLLSTGTKPPGQACKKEPAGVRDLLQQWPRLSLLDGVLVRRMQDSNTQELYQQIVVPLSERQSVWGTLHTSAGHLGTERTLYALRRRFYWPRMERCNQEWVAACERCSLRKARTEGRAPLVPIVTSAPLEVLGMDFLTLSRPADMYKYLLVVTDLFSRFAWVIPTKDQTAQTVAQALWHGVIQPFSCPQRFLSDQGASFESRLIKELCQYYGCVKSRTSSYHPQGNGTCERFNQTLMNLLGTLEKDKQDNWVESLPELVKAYNTTVHASTGFTPHYVVFGTHARLPVDLVQGTWVNQEPVSVEDWVQRHHQRLVGAYQKVSTHAAQAAARQGRYQKGTQLGPLVPGERVLIRTFRRGNGGKLADRWESMSTSPFGPLNLYNTGVGHHSVEMGGLGGREVDLGEDAITTAGTLRRSTRTNLGNPPVRYR